MKARLLNFDRDRQKSKIPHRRGMVRVIQAILLSSSISYGYAVLTHEAIIDSVWDSSLQKLLVKRFSNATPVE